MDRDEKTRHDEKLRELISEEILLPCPHCGSEAHTPTVQWPGGEPIPRCTNPACLAEAKDVAAWNRREPGPGTTAVIEDVRRQVDCGPLDDGEYIFVCLTGREARAFLAENEPAKSKGG